MTRPAVLPLAHGSLRLRVECADPAFLEWLAEFLRPWFQVAGAGAGGRRVAFRIDAARYRTLASGVTRGRPMACFVLDQEIVYAVEQDVGGGRRLLWDERHQVFYDMAADRASIAILAEADHVEARVALMRVVREVAAMESTLDAPIHLHAAAFALGDAGVAIVGAKGAGKTTLLLHALQMPGVAFVANDRLHVHGGAQGPRGHGVPTIVNVRPPTQVMFPGLVARLTPFHHALTIAAARAGSERREPLAGVSPAQLCEAAGVVPRAAAEVRAIVFPSVRDTSRPLAVDRLPAAETARRLVAGLFHAAAPATLATAWTDQPPAPAWTEAAISERCAELASRVPGYAFEMGRLSEWSPAVTEALRRLLDCPA